MNDNNEVIEWQNRTKGDIFIADEAFFRHSDLFLKKYSHIKDIIEKSLTGEIENQQLKSKKNSGKYEKRVGSKELNTGIRSRLKSSSKDIKYEISFNEGVFYDSNKSVGFDLGMYDVKYNVANFYNYCFGRRSIHKGEELWGEVASKNSELESIFQTINSNCNEGEDIIIAKEKPTVLGEIQFGNWALLYRDILKVIKVDKQEDVDLLIYITAAGNLKNYISDSTVNFSKSKEVFEEFKTVLTVPIWLIGVDFR